VSAAALVVIPTHDHALLLPHALRSAQAQTFGDLEVAVIGDGVGDDTRDALAPFLRDDPRIVFHDRPKAGRTGEPHRHEVIRASEARWITYLCDDDLLLPRHLEVVVAALADHDLVHPPQLHVDGDGTLVVGPTDMGDPGWRAVQLAGASLVGLTGLAHTAAAYRRLPFGWRTTPPGSYTDQYMVQQFLGEPWCRARGLATATCVRFPSPLRSGWTADERTEELATWAGRLASPSGVAAFVEAVGERHAAAGAAWRLQALEHWGAAETARAEAADLRRALAATAADLDALRATRAVRARDALVRVSLLRRLLARRDGAR
jgi:GalNAc5-diNAcBac-PP-undecaprenol beta-1,3-glucosyltransferase